MAGRLIHVTDSDFNKTVLQSREPVLVDFWAPWCGPCRAVAPIVEALAESYDGKVTFVQCNVDDNPITAGQFGIRAIPTLILFKNGQVADQITGAVGKAQLEKTLNDALIGAPSSRPFVVT
ncbi:MAG: thioredoxin [Deltaproteobacteria bacterium]|nr:thioredoxin [Deltaproteobacteria bacterium]